MHWSVNSYLNPTVEITGRCKNKNAGFKRLNLLIVLNYWIG